ncbi:hypothetical protein A0H81_09359 [Grifola frondosa]|uniref:Uncharacterized protein n=1 Tax=Grifola frondosa TaxID=5627 RepID=A0A1C7M6R9_GRIFR|nr:hypothetical protein A0H81_09359 [Grifola frondosa]
MKLLGDDRRGIEEVRTCYRRRSHVKPQMLALYGKVRRHVTGTSVTPGLVQRDFRAAAQAMLRSRRVCAKADLV